MAEVVRFRSAQAFAKQQELADQAAQLIDALGSVAGYHIGRMARFAEVDDTHRQRLLALADEIDRRQGFGWFFASDLEESCESSAGPSTGIRGVASSSADH